MPSESNTILAGGGVSPPPITAPTVAMACSAVKMLSPIAVRSIVCNLSIAALVASRLVVGGTRTIALPPNSISPRLIPGVSSSANCLPATSAATNRLGDTSVAHIDGETSIINITTARLRGMRTSWAGPAIPTVSSSIAHTNRTAARCRHLLGRLGATVASSSMFGEPQYSLVTR